MNFSLDFKRINQPVLDIYTKIVNSLDKSNLPCSVFLNFAKAFDTIDHKILQMDSHLSKKECFICFNESPLKMMKNAFYFILKALSIVQIF